MTNTFNRPRQSGASLAHHAIPRITKSEPIPNAYKAGRNKPSLMDLADILSADEVAEITQAGSMAFHCIGDTGGVEDPEPQKLVARGFTWCWCRPMGRTWRRRPIIHRPCM